MSKIKKVEGMPKFPELEDKINQFWKENNTFEKSVEQRPEENAYRFVDGPPFVTGTPHYGSLLPSVAKDVVPRYWTMKGKRVRRVFGWDCHGLPIEEKVNKMFGIKSSKQLEEGMGVEKYVQECRKYVENATSDWRWYIDKVGRWVDMDNAYYTMHPEFMESVIWSFKRIYEQGLIYKGKRVSLYSTDTSTPVSGFEVAMDPSNYRDVEDLSIFVKFKVRTSPVDLPENSYIVAWTTTPWTIPSNFSLAVNPTVDYVLVEFEGENLVVAKPRLEYTFQVHEDQIGTEADRLVRVLKEFKGTELEGLSYEPVYDFFVEQTNENDFKVYLYEGVTVEDGTGVLHLAPAFGEEDFNLGKKNSLSSFSDIDDAGNMTVGEWKGTYLRTSAPVITEDLLNKGNLLRSEMYKHRVPFYRGENPLIYMAQDAYFIDIQKIKARMAELNQDINWIPNHIKSGRFAQTVETSPDWCISRNRYWATVMPLWKSEDGDEIVIGSFDEMMEYTDQLTKRVVEGKTVYFFGEEKMTLHRDLCDKVVLTKDGKEYRRVPEVLDCWMDSGSVPFAEYHYPFENKEIFEKEPSADFIVEYVGQVRAWFNVLLRLSTMLFDDKAFKNVICTGVLAGNDGRKMSKSFGNYPDPKKVLENIGGEALRLYLMGAPIMSGGDMNWSDELLNEQTKNILIPLWNTYKYLTIYTDLHNWTPENAEFTSNNVLDKWLESYMNKVTFEYAKALESYDIPESVKLIQPAIDNISSWWIRRSRDRFVEGDTEAMQTLYAALVQLIKTFAPQMPFVTEEIYQNLVAGILPDAKESVHLEDFPEVNEGMINEELIKEMVVVRKVCTLGLNLRTTNALKLRQPLATAYVQNSDQKQSALRPELLEVVKEELNVKSVTGENIDGNSLKLLTITEEGLTVAIDAEITPELEEEGMLAEVKRQLQNLRKTSGLQMGEKATLQLNSDNEKFVEFITKYKDVLIKDISLTGIDLVQQALPQTLKLEEYQVTANIVK